MLTELKLDWGNMMHVRKLDPVHSQKMAEDPDVFSEGLGEPNGMNVKIQVKYDATPRFRKPIPVPYALKAKVERVNTTA